MFRAGAEEESLNLALLSRESANRKAGTKPLLPSTCSILKEFWKRRRALNLFWGRDEPTLFAPLVCHVLDSQGRALGKIGQIRPSLAKELGGEIRIPGRNRASDT